jgi:hypothetical protein
MMKHVLVAAGLVMAQAEASFAQFPVPAADVQAAVSMLAQSTAAVPEGLRTARLAAATQWLQNNAAKTRAENVTPEYSRSLARAAEVLRTRQTADAVEDVTRELEAKVEHCRRLGVGMGGSVLLSVNTRRGGGVVGDWQVLYLLKFDEWLKTPPRTFPRVSSPTEMNVEPGRYWVWARDPATGTTSDRVLVEVAGQPQLLLDIPVR